MDLCIEQLVYGIMLMGFGVFLAQLFRFKS
jgi:hypothetical protein